jgi:antitoxin component YwqK of YwqJK toxin-antitoxin module
MNRVENELLKYDETSGGFFFDGEAFTGVGFALHPNGELQSEVSYKDGFFDGPSKEWSPDGKLVGEHHFRAGAAHGECRKWHANGNLAEEGTYEFGVPISTKHWDEEGKLLEEFQLTESNPNYETLLMLRDMHKDEQIE